MKATVQAMDSQMTCEVYGEVRHSGNNYPKTLKKHHISTMGFDKVTIMGGTINPAHKEVI